MDVILPIFVFLAALATFAVLTRAGYAGGIARRDVARWTGIELPDGLRDAVVKSNVTFRDRVLAAAVVGAAACFIVTSLGASRDPDDLSPYLISPLFGMTSALATGWILVWRDARRRAMDAGTSTRSHGVRLVDYLGIPVMIAAGVINALAITGIIVGFALLHNESPAYRPVETLVFFCALVVGSVLSFGLAAKVVRMPQSAESDEALAWDDALASNRILYLVAAPSYLAAGLLMILANIVESLIGDYSSHVGWYWLSFAGYPIIGIVALFQPWTQFARSLWPGFFESRRAVEREARRIRREAAKRAYNGLPPLPTSPTTES